MLVGVLSVESPRTEALMASLGPPVPCCGVQLVHEVLACHDESEAGHRYTQTLWFVTEDEAQIADPNDPHWSALRQQHFSDSPASSP